MITRPGIAAIGIFFCVAGHAQDVPSSRQPNNAKPHPIAQQLFQNGALSCAATAHQLASLLSNGKETSVIQLPPANPDHNLVTATMIQPRDKVTSIVTMAFAPNQANGCGASYQAIVYYEKSCARARDEFYPAIKMQALGKTGALLGTLDQKSQVILVAAGNGCLLLNQEIAK